MTHYFDKLKALQARAHAPYSRFRVAAILVAEDGREYVGVNVENASYGGTICAERSAFVSAVSQAGPDTRFREIHLLAGDLESFAMPCGLCRQFMSELAPAEFAVFAYNAAGEHRRVNLGDLLPLSFSSDDLAATAAGNAR